MLDRLFHTSSKIFCIGRNKTGTTSIKKTFKLHDLKVGKQPYAEQLIDAYAVRDFKKIAKYCRSANAFQDIPFSLPYTYIYLDNTFPNSKFILTIRNNVDEWYESLIRFQSKLFNSKDGLPTKEDLQEADYLYKGFAWKVNRILYDTPEDDIYHEATLKESYVRYNEEVQKYFRHKDNLLVINLSEQNAYQKFCDFLELEPVTDDFPWENKNQDA